MRSTIVVGMGVCVLALVLASQFALSRRITGTTWRQLVSRIQPTKMAGITLLAVELQNPGCSSLRTRFHDRLKLVGGLRGLRIMYENSGVLIALAAHADCWNSPESKKVAEELRSQASILRRTVWRIVWTRFTGYSVQRLATHVALAAGTYCTMTAQLFVLYRFAPSEKAELLDSFVWQ